MKAARASRNKEQKFAAHATSTSRAEREAALTNRVQATQEDVQDWLTMLKTRVRDDGRPYVNAQQYEAVAKVARRVGRRKNRRKVSQRVAKARCKEDLGPVSIAS